MLTELQRQTLTIYCSTLNNLHLTRVQYLAPSTGMNTDCRNGRTFGGCWGTNQILLHDLWSQLNTEWSNLVESHLVMKLGPQSPFFPVFQGEGRCWQLGSGLDAAITHPLTYKPSLCCPFITYSHRKARKKGETRGDGWGFVLTGKWLPARTASVKVSD